MSNVNRPTNIKLNKRKVKPNKPWHKQVCRFGWTEFRMNHEQHVGEPSSKVHSVDVMVSGGLGSVHITTFGAVQFDH